MSLALRFLFLPFLGELRKAIACSLQSFAAFGGRRQNFPCGNGTVLNDPPLVHDLLLCWHIQGNCLCIQTAQSQFGATALVAPVELQVPKVAKELAACGCNTGALIPILPPSSSAFGVNSLPSASSIKEPAHRWHGRNRSIVRPKHCVRSIHRPQVPLLVQIVNPQGPEEGWIVAETSTKFALRTAQG